MNRPSHIAIAFGAALAIALAALIWISARLVRLDRAEAVARQQAALEENVRLALWRMDSAVAPLIARENVRPVAAYRAAPSGGPGGPASEGPDPLAAPLPNGATYVRTHFVWDAARQLSVPALQDDMRTADRERLDRLIDARQLLAELPAPSELPAASANLATVPDQELALSGGPSQQSRNSAEFMNRTQYVVSNDTFQTGGGAEGAASPMVPFLLDGEIVLARRVRLGRQELLQGAWLNWNGLEAWLLASIGDLLPQARLIPASAGSVDPGRRMATLPVRLDPGQPLGMPEDGHSPLVWSLGMAWGAFLLAGVAVCVLLAGVVSLSERRAAFVSAVTHELRTPLTTFRLYADLLASGLVHDEAKRDLYLATLRKEAERLTHLVENVLAYARLEKGAAGARLVDVPLGELFDRIAPRLAERAEQAGMELIVSPYDRSSRVRADATAVEQILFNLVDNACKYAAGGGNSRVHLEAESQPAESTIRVRDHGPGVRPAVVRRLFKPFAKSAEEAAESAPGVGVGLPLCRRLARLQGGDLRHISVPEGACFELTLPAAPSVDLDGTSDPQ